MGLSLKLTRALWAPLQASNEEPKLSHTFGLRRVNAEGMELIKAFEGVRLEAYHDPVGFPTQGIGRLLSREKWADLSQWPAITLDEATLWLEQDLQKIGLSYARILPAPLNDNEYAAVTSFAFNLGIGALEASTLRRKLLRNDRLGAAEEFLRWDHAGGRKVAGLTRRRIAERSLFLSS